MELSASAMRGAGILLQNERKGWKTLRNLLKFKSEIFSIISIIIVLKNFDVLPFHFKCRNTKQNAIVHVFDEFMPLFGMKNFYRDDFSFVYVI